MYATIHRDETDYKNSLLLLYARFFPEEKWVRKYWQPARRQGMVH